MSHSVPPYCICFVLVFVYRTHNIYLLLLYFRMFSAIIVLVPYSALAVVVVIGFAVLLGPPIGSLSSPLFHTHSFEIQPNCIANSEMLCHIMRCTK